MEQLAPFQPEPGRFPDHGDMDLSLHHLARLVSILIYAGAILWVIWRFPTGKEFLTKQWWLLAPALLAILTPFAFPSTRRWLIQATAQRRIGIVIFGVLPVVLLSVGAVVLLPPPVQAAALRVIFLGVVCSLPAVLYYLFMATKKYSLLNEFLLNLRRLGLLAPQRLPRSTAEGEVWETKDERTGRIKAYVQKFEAVYGAVPTDLSGMILNPTNPGQTVFDPRMSKTDASGFVSIFALETTVPVVLATVLITLGWLITLPPKQGDLARQSEGSHLQSSSAPQPVAGNAAADNSTGLQTAKWLEAFTPEGTPVQFAFIGAYFFSLQMLFRRYVRRDLRASAYVAVSLRIVLSLIGTWVVVAATTANPLVYFGARAKDPSVDANTLLVMGFVIGVFPRVVWQVVQAAVKRFSGATFLLPSLQAQLPLSDLDGLTVWHEARLEEEDIENIPNMATADLIDLIINTRFSPDRLIDWMDQAILLTHLGPETAKDSEETRRAILRRHGIRTASELVEVHRRSEARNEREAFERILGAPEGCCSPLRSLVDAVSTNSTLQLIQIWRGLEASEAPVVAAPASLPASVAA
jgi:hypothetical protein